MLNYINNIFGTKKRILILAANPKDTTTLRLGEEISKIERSLRSGKHRDKFVLLPIMAAQVDDLHRILADDPTIIHFSGHGDRNGFYFENESGFKVQVTGEQIAALLKECANLECVILNACYSKKQAEDIIKYAPYVISISSVLADQVAIKFSQRFYSALAENISIETAYNYGRIAVGSKNSKILKYTRSLAIDEDSYQNIADKPVLIINKTAHNKFIKTKRIKIMSSIITTIAAIIITPFIYNGSFDWLISRPQTLEHITVETCGKVKRSNIDSDQYIPIANAKIAFDDFDKSTQTNPHGDFCKKITTNIYQLNDDINVTITHKDYETKSDMIAFGQKKVVISLTPK